MLRYIKETVKRNEFNPTGIAIIFNPFYIARKGLSLCIKELGSSITGRTVDIGCGTKPYQNFFTSSEYIGLEYDTGIDTDKKEADYYYSGDAFPFENSSFDSAVCNQVLEHVFNPTEFMSEINRILKKGGKLLLTVPFVWDEHEQPYDYARYSSFGLEHLIKSNGFSIIKSKKSIKDFRVIPQLISGFIYKRTRKIPALKQVLQLLIVFPVNLIGSIIGLILPDNEDLYLDNVILAEKVKDI